MADPTGMIIGAAISTIGGLIGGSKAAKAARQQAEMMNEAAHRQLYYDVSLWEMSKEKISADRKQAVDTIELQARNEGKLAAFKDATNLQRYNYDMMIRNREQTSLNEEYLRSDDIYNKQITFNARSAKSGRNDELRKLQEIHAEAAFDEQEETIQALINRDKLRARGISGRTAGKLQQVSYYELGETFAKIDESLASAGRNTRAVLEQIQTDWDAADLAAFAQKMLDPGVLPEPIVPFQTPMADYIYPREMDEFDFGPRPVLGAVASPSAAANQAWGSAIAGIASGVGSAAASHDWT